MTKVYKSIQPPIAVFIVCSLLISFFWEESEPKNCNQNEGSYSDIAIAEQENVVSDVAKSQQYDNHVETHNTTHAG